jgi:hypothetical protein
MKFGFQNHLKIDVLGETRTRWYQNILGYVFVLGLLSTFAENKDPY